MKNSLLAGTTLAIVGLLAIAPAQAADKISLNLGGFTKWWVVGAWQDPAYERAQALSGNGGTSTVDVKGDNELYFSGTTKLDNGLKVGVKFELESGGQTNQGTWDKAYATIDGGFGKLIAGIEDNGAKLLHVSAPDAAGNSLVKDTYIIARPNAVTRPRGGFETPIGGKADGITYVTPSLAGLTLGASYLPDTTSSDAGVAFGGNQVYGLGALYAATFSDVAVKASLGWATYDLGNSSGGVGGAANSHDWSAGLQASYAGFTLGGSLRRENHSFDNTFVTATSTSTEGDTWDIGVQYATGPYAVSVKYFQSSTDGLLLTAGDDKLKWWQASAKYTMGPGVDLLGSVLHADFEDETTAAANNNKGWAVMTGLGLAF